MQGKILRKKPKKGLNFEEAGYSKLFLSLALICGHTSKKEISLSCLLDLTNRQSRGG